MSEETTVFRGSPSILTRFGALFLGFLIFAGALIGFFMVPQMPYRAMLGGLAALALVYLISVVLLVKSTQYEVTSQRIRVRRGLLTKRTDELELYRANDTSLVEPLSLRLFGLGSIEVRAADSSTPLVYLNAVHGARTLREDIRKYIEECRDRKRVRVTEFDQPQSEEGPEHSS
jgi:uncharacterized membrane protein YdbT with pleckstrin-like domain